MNPFEGLNMSLKKPVHCYKTDCSAWKTCPIKTCSCMAMEAIASPGTRMLVEMACGMTRMMKMIDDHKNDPPEPKTWYAEWLDHLATRMCREGSWQYIAGPTTKSDAEWHAKTYRMQCPNRTTRVIEGPPPGGEVGHG